MAAGAAWAFMLLWTAPAMAQMQPLSCKQRFESATGVKITFREQMHFSGPPSHMGFSLSATDRNSNFYKGSLEGRNAVISTERQLIDRWTPTKTGEEVRMYSYPVLLDSCQTIYMHLVDGLGLPNDVYTPEQLAAARTTPGTIYYRIADYGYGPVRPQLITQNLNVSYPVAHGEKLEVLGVDTRYFGQSSGRSNVMLEVRNSKGQVGLMSSSPEYWSATPIER